MAEHNQLGKKGEELAVSFLQENGHEILATNYRFERAEIDIVSKHNNQIVFTEVKTRSTDLFGDPEEAVTPQKQRHLSRAADAYLESIERLVEARFDIISIIISGDEMMIRHIEEAFFPFE